jgi:ketosteroid isomerase-like protein
MFGFLIERRIRSTFDGLSRGNYTVALNGLADDVHHVFAGDHPLAGERHSRGAVRRWFERLFRLFDLRFDISSINVSGPIWNTVVSVEWVAHVTPRSGAPYENHGAHIIRIRRGRVMYLHAYEDSQKVAEACAVMAAAGIAEAAAVTISD